MTSWEAGPTPYAGPTSPVRQGRAELGTLGATMAPLWLDVLDETARMCAAYGRADLVAWLRHRRAQLLDPHLRVLVVGLAKQGKSQLINALINAPVCAVGDDVGTAVPTIVRHAATPSAQLVRLAQPAPDDMAAGGAAGWPGDPGTGQPASPGAGRYLALTGGGAGPAGPVGPTLPVEWQWALAASAAQAGGEERVPVPVDGAADGFLDLVRHRFGGTELVHAEVGVPRSLLGGGLTLIDTPALTLGAPAGGFGRYDVRALAARTGADLILLACESARELSAAEVELLAELGQLYPSLVIVLTKTDFSPHWRIVLAHNRQCLAHAGVPATLVSVSSVLRMHATRTGDQEVNAESGFPQLIACLQQAVAAKPDRLARSSVGQLGRIVIEQLAVPLRAEMAERSGNGSSDAMARLHEAQRQVDELRRCTTRWQNCLSDEVGDLMSDIEQDLRERTRAILAKVDETFDAADPLRVWDAFESWLRQALQEAAEASFSWLVERTEWLAGRLAEHFPMDSVAVLPQWSLSVPEDLSDRVAGLGNPRVEPYTPSQKIFTGLRGSYGGVLMFGLASTLAGMDMLNPISLGAGAVFGGKSIRDESRSLLRRRQAAARAAVQRHVDEVFVRLNKDAKDTIRRVQRVLRDHFGAVTEDLQQAIVESLRTAKQAADNDVAAREQRLRRIQQELNRLAELYEQVQALTRLRGAAIPGAAGSSGGTAVPATAGLSGGAGLPGGADSSGGTAGAGAGGFSGGAGSFDGATAPGAVGLPGAAGLSSGTAVPGGTVIPVQRRALP